MIQTYLYRTAILALGMGLWSFSTASAQAWIPASAGMTAEAQGHATPSPSPAAPSSFPAAPSSSPRNLSPTPIGERGSRGAQPETGPSREISLDEFLASVMRSNPDYAAERSAVSIADAERSAARLLPNPTISAGHAADPSGDGAPGTIAAGVSQTILLGGKRRARTDVAEQSYAGARAQLADVARTLRAAAASAYADAIVAEQAYERQRRSAETLDRLVAVNEQRLRAGDIGEVDLLQSRVEAVQFRSELLASESARRAARLELSRLMGKRRSDTLYTPAPLGEFQPRAYALDALIDSALARRPDVIAARRGADAARANVRLARANRVSDVDVGVSLQRSTSAGAPGAPPPRWGGLELSVSLPFPLFSTFNRGEVNAARHTAEHAEHVVTAAEVHAESEVRQAHARYEIAVERVGQYTGELLADAEKVLAGRTYSYQRGSAPLVDVLVAQRAVNDVYLAYYEAIGEYLKAQVALEEAAGVGGVAM